jgi:hypothetical protein
MPRRGLLMKRRVDDGTLLELKEAQIFYIKSYETFRTET